MAYTQEISRENKACFLFLVDQSYSMTESLGNSADRKCDQLVLAINSWLQNMGIRAAGDKGIKDWMDIGVIGYRTDQQGNPIVGSVLQGPLAGRTLVSITELTNSPARVENRVQRVPNPETGDFMELPTELPVWVDPVADGGTPMCHTFYQAHAILQQWISEHPKSFPPIVIHITDGESQDGDPLAYADSVKSLATEDGNVLLFNCHLSQTAADSFMFPNSDEVLPDEYARVLYKMSSELPEPVYQRALAEKDWAHLLQPHARGMAFNADMVCLIKFLDMGTRVAGKLR